MTSFAGHPQAMLTEIYIDALLVDEELADQVWEAWDMAKPSKDGEGQLRNNPCYWTVTEYGGVVTGKVPIGIKGNT